MHVTMVNNSIQVLQWKGYARFLLTFMKEWNNFTAFW